MKRTIGVLAGLFVLACVGGTAVGQVYTAGPGLALAIPDNTYNGTLASMGCSNLAVSAGGGGGDFVATMTVQIAMSHTFVGDLTIKLTSPSATTFTLLSRPGVTETADDGNDTAGFGENSNLAIANPLTYDDTAVDASEQMGKVPIDLSTTQTICVDGGSPCTYAPSHGAATSAATFALAFAGQTKVGTWQLCIGDSAGADTGTLDSWSLNITSTTPVELQRFAVD